VFELNKWFVKTNKLFKIFRYNCLDYHNQNKRRIFIDRKSKVLLIAHADTVLKPNFRWKFNNKIYATGLDDRIGCWIIYCLSRELKTDLLITDKEESAGSTALHHNCKDYNWVAEFDRRGEDIVLYDTGSTKFEKALRKYFKIGWGTFSDICFLDTTAACVNIGTGVQNEHFTNSFADLDATQRQIDKFKQFYKKYKDTSFIKDYKEGNYRLYTGYSNYSKYWGGYNIEENTSSSYNCVGKCGLCGKRKIIFKEVEIDGDIWKLCEHCYNIFNDCISEDYKSPQEIQCKHCHSYVDIEENSYGDGLICPYCYNTIIESNSKEDNRYD